MIVERGDVEKRDVISTKVKKFTSQIIHLRYRHDASVRTHLDYVTQPCDIGQMTI